MNNIKNKYVKIAEEIKEDIFKKKFKIGSKLPSIRVLCEKYNCSKGTVIKAYDELQRQHIIYSIPQSGYYVVENIIPNTKSSNNIIDFSTGIPEINSIYNPDLKYCLNNAAEIYKLTSTNFYFKGKDSLIDIMPSYLADSKIFTFKENIYVNLGIGQAISILARMPFPNNGDTILVEQPTYKSIISFLQSYNYKVIGINRNKYGINLDELENIFKTKNIKFFYTVPRNHNPLGTCYSKDQVMAIAKLAKKYNVYIVEDDYFGDIEFDKKYDPIFSHGDYQHHIYLRSISKVIPWLRLGICVIPTNLLPIFEKEVSRSYYNSYFTASFISQSIFEVYLKSNLLKKHTNEIKQHLISKQYILNNHKLNKSNFLSYNSSGIYSYIHLPNHVKEKFILKNIKAQNVIVADGSNFFLSKDDYQSGFRISIAKVSNDDLKKGLDIIYKEIIN